MLSVLAELRQERTDEFVVFGDSVGRNSAVLSSTSWELRPLSAPSPTRNLTLSLGRLLLSLLTPSQREFVHSAYRHLRRPNRVPAIGAYARRPDTRDWLASCGIDLMLYPTPIPLAFEAETPYVMAVHDIQHRIHPEFPEVSAGYQYAWREYTFRNGIQNALMILVDSEIGKEDVLAFYGDFISAERIAVLPFLPATPLNIGDEDHERVKRLYQLLPIAICFTPRSSGRTRII